MILVSMRGASKPTANAGSIRDFVGTLCQGTNIGQEAVRSELHVHLKTRQGAISYNLRSLVFHGMLSTALENRVQRHMLVARTRPVF